MNLAPPRGRLLAVAILVMLVAAAGLITAQLYAAYQQNRETIRDRQATLGRVNAVIAQSDAVDQWIGGLAQGLDDGAFLPGEGDAVSSADLQARLVNITANNGAVLGSFRAMEPQPLEGLVDVGVEIALQGDFPSVQATIATIESSLPLFFLEKAQFRAVQGGDPTPGSKLMLEVQLEIHGYARRGAAAPSGT